MSFTDLRSYLAALKSRGELREIRSEVDPKLEIAEIHRRVIAAGGPALLFSNPKGSRFPVVTNLFGTLDRVRLAFGGGAREFIEAAAALPHEMLPPTLPKIWQRRNFIYQATKVGTRTVSGAPVTARYQRPTRLSDLPALTTWEKDGGPFLTLPLVYTEHPELGIPNLGMYRMQVFDDSSTGMHMQIGKGGGFHLKAAQQLKTKLNANVFLGGPPAMILAAISPLPENVPEVLLASLVIGKKLRLAKHHLSALPLLADAEFVLSGTIDPEERRPEGPFGDHYGYYSLTHDFPVFRCSTIFRRKDAIFPATVVGKPRQEDFYIGDFLQEMLAPLFPVVMPSVRDLWSYGETGFHSLASAVVQERYKREAMMSGFRILGEGQLSLTKFLLLVDQKIDLRNFPAVLEHVLARTDFRTDLYIFSNLSMDTLDYAGPKLNEGSKGILLGIGKPIRELPTNFAGQTPNYLNAVQLFCRGCLVVSGESYQQAPDLGERVARDPVFADWPLIVLCDRAEEACRDSSAFLWTTFTRFDPAADIHAQQVELYRLHPGFTPPVVIDARMKPNYPDELFCDPKTAELVDRRWNTYS